MYQLGKRACWILFAFSAFSCATFYEINTEFNQNFESGNIEQAADVLNHSKKWAKGKARFLYYANQGVVASLQGNLEESNDWFEQAYQFGENYRTNAGEVAASYLVNPNTITYRGEDHEQLLLLYYKALNLLKMNDLQSALIECRRLNERLNTLSDKYKSDKKYREDAFINNLMGIIYEAAGEYNNAFIAYRNAIQVYESDYLTLFNLGVPEQLKTDVLRAAAKTGFDDQVDFFERKFERTYVADTSSASLVFFWHNGLGPVKEEWSINFTTIDGGDGFVTFANEDLGLSFPFQIGDSEKSQLTDLRFFRIAFPKYQERTPYFERAILETTNKTYELNLAENLDAIAKKTLQERMIQELGKGLLRAALKKSLETAVRNGGSDDEDNKEEAMREGLSLLIGIINATTEKADTRNWSTIPHSIYYTRVPLQKGNNKVTLTTMGPTEESSTFEFQAAEGQTIIHTFQSLESK